MMPVKPRPIKPPVRSEASVLRGCLKTLDLLGIVHWRNNTGAFKVGGRFVRCGVKGGSDILAVLPGGRLWVIEAKRPGGKPTADQEAFMQAVRSAGAAATVVTDESELIDAAKWLTASEARLAATLVTEDAPAEQTPTPARPRRGGRTP